MPRASGLHAQGDGSSFRLGCNAHCDSKATLQCDRRMSALAQKAEWGDDHVSSGPCMEMSHTKSLTSLVPIRRDVLAFLPNPVMGGVNNESRSPEISKKRFPPPSQSIWGVLRQRGLTVSAAKIITGQPVREVGPSATGNFWKNGETVRGTSTSASSNHSKSCCQSN